MLRFKRLFVAIITLLFFTTLISCVEKPVYDDSVPEYYEDGSVLGSNKSNPKLGSKLFLRSGIKTKTAPEESKIIEVAFHPEFGSFEVDDPNLEGLSTKEILELYSDFDQKLTISINRIIFNEKRSDLHFSIYGTGYNIANEIIYTKEVTLGYFVKEFPDDFKVEFSINYDELSAYNEEILCVAFCITITPSEDDVIKLYRPVANIEMSDEEPSVIEREGINAGDKISYFNFRKRPLGKISRYVYVNLYVGDGIIMPYPYGEQESGVKDIKF